MGTGPDHSTGHAFGELLKRYREAAGLTQDELAGRAEMSVRGLIYLERGRRQPYPHTVRRLADTLALAPHERATFANAARPVSASPPASAQDPTLDLAVLPPLIGRQPELHVIGTILDQLTRGRGAVLGLEGEAGIGKTRLAQEILLLGRQRRWHVLLGSGHEQEGQLPYLPFVEALREALRIDPAGAELIPAELAVAIPELPVSAVVSLPDRLAAQSALFAGVLRFVAMRARHAPLVLILDDLHAVDAGSLKLLHYLARATMALPLLLVCSWRPHEPGSAPELADTISSLERLQLLQRLPLTPLSGDEHCALLAQALGGGSVDPHLAAALYRHSEGNALFAREMARQLKADGGIVRTDDTWRFAAESDASGLLPARVIPQSLQALARRRLASLSPAAAQLLQMAAIVGRDVPLPVLEHELQAGAALLDLLDETLAAGLLTEAGLTVRFPHPLLRAAIYEQMSRARRTTLHGAVASILETLHADAPDTIPVEAIAYHYRHAGNSDRAIHYLLQAGDRAEAVYDHDGALHRYGEALALAQEGTVAERARVRAEVQERIGDAYRMIGDVARGLDAYRQALDTLGRTATSIDRGRRFALHRKITLGAILTVDMPVAAEHLALARALIGPDPLDEARLQIAEALFAWHALQFEAALAHASRAQVIAARAGARVEESQAYEMLALAHLPLGNWAEGLRCESLRHTPDWSPDVMVAIDAHLCLYQYKLHSAESLQQAQRFIESVAQQAATVGNQRCLAVCYFVFGNLAMWQGLPEAAAANLARALDLHERIGSPAGMAYTLARQVELLTAAGVYAPAPRLLERGIEAAQQAAIRDHCLAQLYAAGLHNRLAAGDNAGAAALAEAARAHDATCPPCAVCRVDLYEALAVCHFAFAEIALALSHVDRALQLADFAQNRSGRARLVRTRGQIHAALGEMAEAERDLRDAADSFRAIGDQYDLARTLQALATLEGGQDGTALCREAEAILTRYSSVSLAAVTGS